VDTLYLLKYGELSLKGRNRRLFEERVCDDIRRKLAGSAAAQVELRREWGRLFLSLPGNDTRGRELVEQAVAHTFGLVGFARSWVVDQDMDQICQAAVRIAAPLREAAGFRFKIEARRSDKSFPYSSYQIACVLGELLRTSFPELKVDLTRPDWVLQVEVRRRVYLHGPVIRAPGGLPLGSSGRGLLLLSGGIDSPVAGYLMAKRGLAVDAVYFHTPPYTSGQARDKVVQLGRILSAYITGLKVFVVPFTDIQLRVNQQGQAEERTLLVRAAMMSIADRLARRQRASCLITGESLGQVASQTVQSLHFTGSSTRLPVFRPLIGLDKEEIISMARAIGTYETSILPYEDCCALFAPQHPLVKPDFSRLTRSLAILDLEELMELAVAGTETVAV
jgi:thiamine biosynthesis protein ThiI